MPIVSLPSVITNAPLSAACRATTSRYIRKCMEISEWSFHSNRFHFVVLRNLVDYVLSLGDLSENGVDSVKVRLGSMTDEELAAAGVLPGVGHGQGPRDVLVDVLLGLALDGVAGPAGADASLPGLRNRVTTLNHEVRDHAVKLGAVIESRVRELLEVGDRADRKSTRLNSSHQIISYAVFCLKKKKINQIETSELSVGYKLTSQLPAGRL